MVYEFKNIRGLAEATMKATRFKVPYENKTTKESSFWLVKDEGVYLMPSFKLPKGDTASSTGLMVYADGHDPNKDAFEDWWVGGDDYAETIPVNHAMLANLVKGGELTIKITQSDIEVIA